jgi:hypothetical protein
MFPVQGRQYMYSVHNVIDVRMWAVYLPGECFCGFERVDLEALVVPRICELLNIT